MLIDSILCKSKIFIPSIKFLSHLFLQEMLSLHSKQQNDMKIISSQQLKELDKYTIIHEPIASIDLMERAAHALTEAIIQRWDKSFEIIVFAGPGNNGGDALAVARMLSQKNYHVEVYLFNTQGKLSEECATNLNRLKTCGSVYFTEVSTQFDPPTLTDKHLVIDGLFGSGLNKPLSGGFAAVVKYINASKAQVVSIDIPSGLMGEDNTYNIRTNIIHANVTLSIQLPKLAFFFPENEDIIGEWELLDIGLKKEFIDAAESAVTGKICGVMTEFVGKAQLVGLIQIGIHKHKGCVVIPDVGLIRGVQFVFAVPDVIKTEGVHVDKGRADGAPHPIGGLFAAAERLPLGAIGIYCFPDIGILLHIRLVEKFADFSGIGSCLLRGVVPVVVEIPGKIRVAVVANALGDLPAQEHQLCQKLRQGLGTFVQEFFLGDFVGALQPQRRGWRRSASWSCRSPSGP